MWAVGSRGASLQHRGRGHIGEFRAQARHSGEVRLPFFLAGAEAAFAAFREF